MTATDESDDHKMPAIVIDTGSFTTKAGFGGDDAPRAVFPSVVGTKNNNNKDAFLANLTTEEKDKKDFYIGDEALAKKNLSLQYPMQRGIITNWDHMEKIWHSTFFNELRKDPEEHAVLLTEYPLTSKGTSKGDREKKTQIMFKTFNVAKYYLATSSLMSLYAAGRTTGVVLESGYGVTHIVPCFEGYIVPHVMRLEMGGLEVSEYLAQQLKINDATFRSNYGSSSKITSSERETVRDIKSKLCYVAEDYNEEIKKSEEQEYELPDGQIITMDNDRFECTELLFKPDLFTDIEEDGIHGSLKDVIFKCDKDIRRDLWNNIVLSGGNTMFSGLQERLTNELAAMDIGGYSVKVVAPPERKYSVWIGGAILSSLSTFEEMWITKDEYKEGGASIVHRKCI